MRALVLSAGYGTRLGELTAETPKPILDIDGRPLIALILANLGRQGIVDVAVNLHFRPDDVIAAIGDGRKLGVRIHYVREPELLGTLGAAKNLEGFLTEEGDFLLHYGDVVTDQELEPLKTVHAGRGAAATILVHRRRGSNSVAVLEPGGQVSSFLERPDPRHRARAGSDWAFSGLAVVGRELLAEVPPGPADLPADLLPVLAAARRLYGVPLTGYRTAVDSAERLESVRRDLREHRIRL